MDEMTTSRELSLEMIGKTRRISKLTPSAAPSVVARGFRDSYRSDGLRFFPETSVPVYDKAVYPPRSCRRARSVHFALADPIESPAERESGLLIPRRRGPLRFTGPVQNHVELVRRRAFIAPDHEEPLAVRRGLVVREAVIVQEEGGPIKKPARRSEGTVRTEIDGDHRLARDVEH